MYKLDKSAQMYVFAESIDIIKVKIKRRYLDKQGNYTDTPVVELSLREAIVASHLYKVKHIDTIKHLMLSGVWVHGFNKDDIVVPLSTLINNIEPPAFFNECSYNLSYYNDKTTFFVDSYNKGVRDCSTFKGASIGKVLVTAFDIVDKPIKDAIIYNIDTGSFAYLLDVIVGGVQYV